MALDMNKATQAVGISQMENLITRFQQNIDKIKDKLSKTDADYQAFMNVVNENWSGTSKDDFMRDFQDKCSKARNELNDLKTQVRRDLINSQLEFMTKDAQVYKSN